MMLGPDLSDFSPMFRTFWALYEIFDYECSVCVLDYLYERNELRLPTYST